MNTEPQKSSPPWAHAETQFTPGRCAEILTISGEYFQFENTEDTAGMAIDVIAHALSLVNRFAGHTRVPYSVAEHSVRVSYECDPEHALIGLLHDATEAYLADVVRPAKALLPDYQALEQRLWHKIARVQGIDQRIPDSVHRADAVLCATEARDLIHPTAWQDWGLPYPPLTSRIVPCDEWWEARYWFLCRYLELTTT